MKSVLGWGDGTTTSGVTAGNLQWSYNSSGGLHTGTLSYPGSPGTVGRVHVAHDTRKSGHVGEYTLTMTAGGCRLYLISNRINSGGDPSSSPIGFFTHGALRVHYDVSKVSVEDLVALLNLGAMPQRVSPLNGPRLLTYPPRLNPQVHYREGVVTITGIPFASQEPHPIIQELWQRAMES